MDLMEGLEKMQGNWQGTAPAEQAPDIVHGLFVKPADFSRGGAIVERDRADEDVLGRIVGRFEQG